MRSHNKMIWAAVFLAAAVLWVCVIWHFSAQPASQSSALSDGICLRVARHIAVRFHPDWQTGQIEELAGRLVVPVRKSAHMSEYAVLGFLLAGAVRCIGVQRIRLYFPTALAVVYLCAAADEFHQTFVPGRDGNVIDTLIDSTGGAVGILLSALLAFLYFRFIRRIRSFCSGEE